MAAAPSVLLIEDSPVLLEILKQVLGVLGCEVTGEAANQKNGVAKFRAEKPDLVLLDIRLAIGDGIEALAEIREIDPDAYVVMLTAMDNPEIRARCRDLGAKGFIAKGRAAADIIDDLAPHIDAVSAA